MGASRLYKERLYPRLQNPLSRSLTNLARLASLPSYVGSRDLSLSRLGFSTLRLLLHPATAITEKTLYSVRCRVGSWRKHWNNGSSYPMGRRSFGSGRMAAGRKHLRWDRERDGDFGDGSQCGETSEKGADVRRTLRNSGGVRSDWRIFGKGFR